MVSSNYLTTVWTYVNNIFTTFNKTWRNTTSQPTTERKKMKLHEILAFYKYLLFTCLFSLKVKRKKKTKSHVYAYVFHFPFHSLKCRETTFPFGQIRILKIFNTISAKKVLVTTSDIKTCNNFSMKFYAFYNGLLF